MNHQRTDNRPFCLGLFIAGVLFAVLGNGCAIQPPGPARDRAAAFPVIEK